MQNTFLKKILWIIPIIGILTTFAINYNEYFPNGSTIYQNSNSGWVTPVSGASKEIITPEWCKKITGNWASKMFIPTRNSTEWNAFKTSAAGNNITISECTYYCPAKVADGYSLGQWAENELVTKTKTITHGSCSRTFQCDKTSTMWIPTTDPSCNCNPWYIWNGSACVNQNQTKTMSCAGVIPANWHATGNATYTSSSSDGGITWSPVQMSWYPAGVTNWAQTFTNPSWKLGANKLWNNDATADQYCKEMGYNNGGIILSGDDFDTCSDNSISWWWWVNWRWQWACSNNSFIDKVTCSWTKWAPEWSKCEFTCDSWYTWKESTQTCSPISQIFYKPHKQDTIPSSSAIAAFSPATRIKWCQEHWFDKWKVLSADYFDTCSDNRTSYFNGSIWQNPGACSVWKRVINLECTQWMKWYTWEWPFDEWIAPNFSMSIWFYSDTPTTWESWWGCNEWVCTDPIIHNYTNRCNAAKCTDNNGNIVSDALCGGWKPANWSNCYCVAWDCPPPPPPDGW